MSTGRSIPSHLTPAERSLLTSLARGLPPNAVAVEIGSYLGASACALAMGLKDAEGHLYAVDTWTNLAMTEGERDTFAEFRRNVATFGDRITALRGLSTDVATQFEGPVHLLFIDGDHAYQAVRADLEAWLRHLVPGGVVAMHDYGWAEGVRRAVREILTPLQTEGGRRLDELYWSRVDPGIRPPELRATVIVPTYGRPELLADALTSAAGQNFPATDFEIVVVDNQPGDEPGTSAVAKIVKRARDDHRVSIRYLPEPRTGLHHARHRGATAARGEILAYVDDDVLLPSDWLVSILGPFEDSSVGIVGGRIVPRWESEPPEWWRHFPASYLSLLDLGSERSTLQDPGLVYGCNMAVRRSTLFEAGGFPPDSLADPRLLWLRGDGETGLCRKASAAGWVLVHEPRAWLEHRIAESRLTGEAMCQRGLKSGLSLSYAHIRAGAGRRGWWVRLVHGGTRAMLRAASRAIRARWPGRGTARLRDASDAWLWFGYGCQHLRAAVDSKLRRELLRDTHLCSTEASS